jgi:predicted transcriptional regulator
MKILKITAVLSAIFFSFSGNGMKITDKDRIKVAAEYMVYVFGSMAFPCSLNLLDIRKGFFYIEDDPCNTRYNIKHTGAYRSIRENLLRIGQRLSIERRQYVIDEAKRGRYFFFYKEEDVNLWSELITPAREIVSKMDKIIELCQDKEDEYRNSKFGALGRLFRQMFCCGFAEYTLHDHSRGAEDAQNENA